VYTLHQLHYRIFNCSRFILLVSFHTTIITTFTNNTTIIIITTTTTTITTTTTTIFTTTITIIRIPRDKGRELHNM